MKAAGGMPDFILNNTDEGNFRVFWPGVSAGRQDTRKSSNHRQNRPGMEDRTYYPFLQVNNNQAPNGVAAVFCIGGIAHIHFNCIWHRLHQVIPISFRFSSLPMPCQVAVALQTQALAFFSFRCKRVIALETRQLWYWRSHEYSCSTAKIRSDDN